MKKANIITETYNPTTIWMVDIVTKPDEELFEAWLYTKRIGVKSFMFGMPFEQRNSSVKMTKELFMMYVDSELDRFKEIFKSEYPEEVAHAIALSKEHTNGERYYVVRYGDGERVPRFFSATKEFLLEIVTSNPVAFTAIEEHIFSDDGKEYVNEYHKLSTRELKSGEIKIYLR